jgi:hypothetical protein
MLNPSRDIVDLVWSLRFELSMIIDVGEGGVDQVC